MMCHSQHTSKNDRVVDARMNVVVPCVFCHECTREPDGRDAVLLPPTNLKVTMLPT